MMILNLTQHPATPEQVKAGVVDVTDVGQRAEMLACLTFSTLPGMREVKAAANQLADLAVALRADHAMIGGAPFLMPVLDQALRTVGITPLFAFSVRRSVEVTQPDGSVKKESVFVHEGFVG